MNPANRPTRVYPLSLGNELHRARAVAAGTMTPTERDADRIEGGQRIISQKIKDAMRLLHDQGVTADEYADFLSARKRDDDREASLL